MINIYHNNFFSFFQTRGSMQPCNFSVDRGNHRISSNNEIYGVAILAWVLNLRKWDCVTSSEFNHYFSSKINHSLFSEPQDQRMTWVQGESSNYMHMAWQKNYQFLKSAATDDWYSLHRIKLSIFTKQKSAPNCPFKESITSILCNYTPP